MRGSIPSLAPLALLLLAGASCTNLHAVEEGKLYRSGQPSAAQLEEWIERFDLKTVVRLRGGGPGNESYEASHGPAVRAGIAFVQVPMSARAYPSRETLLRLWETFATGAYPMLVHCRAGADRTGLASALYVLQKTGSLDRAREQLSFLPYLHTGWFGTGKLDEVLDMYEPWQGRLSFPDWVRTEYRIPGEELVEPARPPAEGPRDGGSARAGDARGSPGATRRRRSAAPGEGPPVSAAFAPG